MARRIRPMTRLDHEAAALISLSQAREALYSVNLRTARGCEEIREAVRNARAATEEAIALVHEAIQEENVYAEEQSIRVVTA